MIKTIKTLAGFLTVIFFMSGHQAFAQQKTSNSENPIESKELKQYTGKYDPEGNFFSITISLDGEDRLMAQPTDKSQPLTLMSFKGKDKFELVGTNGLQISFNRDDKQKIISLTFSEGGRSFTAKRTE